MDKESLLEIAKNYTAQSEQDVLAVINLTNRYPYSQFLHVLTARITKEKLPQAHDHHLHEAAVYISDRSVLKEIIEYEVSVTAPLENADDIVSAPEVSAPIPASAPTKQSEPKIAVTKGNEDIAEDLRKDLERLNELKHNFEVLYADQHLVSTPDAVAQNEHEPVADAAAEPPAPRRRKKTQVQENLIDEIQTTKVEIEPENDRQREQIVIIDQFIKTQPSISPAKEKSPASQTDLNSIKSGEFSENIVSETLVEILLKQGKKDRAIEVLKKLIWKYPQKKAYFASQIEDLKK